MADASRDQNSVPTLLGVSNVDGTTPIKVYVDPVTHRLLVDIAGPGVGTVTSVSVVSANGFAGSVATATTTPAITLRATPVGILQSDGTSLSAIVVGTGLTFVGGTLSAPGTGGTVTSVSVVTANGVSGSVATATTTPAITLTLGAITPTSVNGLTLLALATGFSIAGGTASKTLTISNTLTLAGTDGSTLNIGAGGTLGSAAFTSASAYEVPLTFSTGLTRTVNTVTVNTTQNITKLSNLTSNGLVTTSAGDGTLGITVPGTGILTFLATPSSANLLAAMTDETGTGALVFATSPTLVTPLLGTPTSGVLTNCTGLPAASVVAGTLGTGAYTMDTKLTVPQVINTNNAIAASGNAATVPITSRISTVTNNSAATLTITLTTTSAVDGQMVIVRILDFSAAAQTITWVNTENSTVTAPVTSNGSTTLPLTVGFQYNNATSKWRCIASA